jgi:hypothetical protein
METYKTGFAAKSSESLAISLTKLPIKDLAKIHADMRDDGLISKFESDPFRADCGFAVNFDTDSTESVSANSSFSSSLKIAYVDRIVCAFFSKIEG